MKPLFLVVVLLFLTGCAVSEAVLKIGDPDRAIVYKGRDVKNLVGLSIDEIEAGGFYLSKNRTRAGWSYPVIGILYPVAMATDIAISPFVVIYAIVKAASEPDRIKVHVQPKKEADPANQVEKDPIPLDEAKEKGYVF